MVAEYSLDNSGDSLLPFLWFHFINVESSATANSAEHYPSAILQLFSFTNKIVNLFSLLPNLWNFFNPDTCSPATLFLPWTSSWFGSFGKQTYWFFFNMVIMTQKKHNQPTNNPNKIKTTSIQELWIYEIYTACTDQSNTHLRKKYCLM